MANDAHHAGPGGTGIKGSDYGAVSLCREAHTYLHDHGVARFEAKYGIKLLVVLFQTIHLYVSGQRAALPASLLR